MNKETKLSVCVVCYNQEEYIAKCLQSLVDQETDFDFEIIVSDDCSTDNTAKIIQEFKIRYPELIKPIFHKRNLGMLNNYLFAHSKAKGIYIAHIDGDDYSLPGKLQNQSDFLDMNVNCNIVWHPMNKLSLDGSIKSTNDSNMTEIMNRKFYRKDIIELMAIGSHSSKMYRKKVRDFTVPDEGFIDYYINVEQVGSGYAAYSSKSPLGVYRTEIGVSSVSSMKIAKLNCISFIIFSKKYPQFRRSINTAALTCFLVDLKNMRPSAKLYLKVYIKTFSFSSIFKLYKNYKFIKYINV